MLEQAHGSLYMQVELIYPCVDNCKMFQNISGLAFICIPVTCTVTEQSIIV